MRVFTAAATALLASVTTAQFQQIPLRAQAPVDSTAKFTAPPLLGFGTWNLDTSPENTTDAVSYAIFKGYRHIDCAAAYGNQKAVGKGIADGLERTGLKRNDIWVTSKLWNDHHAPDKVEAGLNQTLTDLGLEYLDLFLMHWPVGNSPSTNKLEFDYAKTWAAMIALITPTPANPNPRVRHIGVSNFSPHQLRKLLLSSHKPFVHQMELHPYLHQTWWIKFHQIQGIHVTAYSPLGDTNPTYHDLAASPPRLLDNPVLEEIGKERGCTTAQVSLAWGIGRGTSVIPKSKHQSWIEENYKSQACPLVASDVVKIEKVGRKWLTRFNNPSKDWGVKLFEGLDGVQ